MKFYLYFKSDNYGRQPIDEPGGFSSVDFQLKQEENRYARDISFSGGESNFEFSKWRNHELEMLIYYFQHFGYESKVQLIIDFEDGNETVVGDLDFKEAETDELTYFKCKAIQDSLHALIKRRRDINTNCFSDKTLDDSYIQPLTTENVLLKAKPVGKASEWNTPAHNFVPILPEYGEQNAYTHFFNFANNITSSDISDTLSYIQGVEIDTGEGTANPGIFIYLNATDNLTNVTVKISNLNVVANYLKNAVGTGAIGLKVVVGNDVNAHRLNINVFDPYQFTGGDESHTFADDYFINIGGVNRTEKIWIFWTGRVTGSSTIGVEFTSMDVTITANSVAYNTIVPSFRLYDVMKYNMKSISGAEIDAPHFGIGGQFYDQRLFNGNFLRGIKDKPFYITTKDIEGGIIEMNSDYEIKPNGSVFFGLFEDYYTSTEIGFINKVQFDSFKKTYNNRFALNEFKYGYSSYQSQKENTKDNTYDVVHGESQWLFGNKMVENRKEVEVKWVRDSFEIEVQRQNAFDKSTSTATQDDNKLFCVDTLEITDESERYFTETDTLLHSYNASTGYNTLTNNGSFNWLLLGIAIGDTFELLNTENIGVHEVVLITSNSLTLQRISPGVSFSEGEAVTIFRYYVSPDTAQYMIWTNEGFSVIDGLNNGEKYANLRFTKKRNILNFWSKYIASANLYAKKVLKNTFYKNNPDCETIYEGSQVKEGLDFLPENPILSPMIYESMVFIMDYADFVQLQENLRTQRGFIRVIDNNEHVVKVYPKMMKYIIEKSELTIEAEEKYEPANMTITADIPGMILINNETRVHSINYKLDKEKLFIFDENDELLYNGVFWDKVTINSASPETRNELKQWLDLL